MTTDDIAATYTKTDGVDLARDLKVMILGVMEQSGCSRTDAIIFVVHLLTASINADV